MICLAMTTIWHFLQPDPEWLPRPIHQNFYPNAYVTRQDFINLLMLVDGIPMQVSTSMHVSERIDIPKNCFKRCLALGHHNLWNMLPRCCRCIFYLAVPSMNVPATVTIPLPFQSPDKLPAFFIQTL